MIRMLGGSRASKVVFLLIIAGVVWGGVPVSRAEPPSGPMRLLDKPSPDFPLSLFTGEKVRLADFRGKVVVLNFWAAG